MINSLQIQIQKLHEHAVIPEYAHVTDAGVDLFSSVDMTIEPHARALVPTGIAMAIPNGYVGLVWDKSGLAVSAGLTTMAGVIDSGYRGEIQIAMYNTTSEPYEVKAGNKIAQLLIQPIHQAQFKVVTSLSESDRGEGGFGSTGLASKQS